MILFLIENLDSDYQLGGNSKFVVIFFCVCSRGTLIVSVVGYFHDCVWGYYDEHFFSQQKFSIRMGNQKKLNFLFCFFINGLLAGFYV